MNAKQIKLTATVPETLSEKRLDVALAHLFPQYSRARLQRFIKKGEVTIDGQQLKQNEPVLENQTIVIDAMVEPEDDWAAENIPLNIIYEDESIMIINKPDGLVVHPGAGNPKNTMVNALLHHDPALNIVPRAGIVHRLDKDTSGIMVVARTLEAHTYLVQAIQNREVKRCYEAIVEGTIISGATVDAPMGRHPKARTKMAVTPSGKDAVSHYRVIERFAHYTHIKVELETGRTHQIRVHMAHIHHPIVGDKKYNPRLRLPKNTNEALKTALRDFPRQALHAKTLTLKHPKTGETMTWQAPTANDMMQLLKVLRDDTHE